jgi:hypothetical protein
MNRTIGLLLPLLLAPSGCIIYENTGDQNLASDWWDESDEEDMDPSDGTSDDGSSGLIVTPDHALAGETLLITLTSTADIDLSLVVDVSFSANVTVHDLSVEDDEVLIVATVDAGNASGAGAIDVELADGQVFTVDAPFVVTAPEPTDDSGCN